MSSESQKKMNWGNFVYKIDLEFALATWMCDTVHLDLPFFHTGKHWRLSLGISELQVKEW